MTSTFTVRLVPFTVVLAVAAGIVTHAAAPAIAAPSIKNLRGTWKGLMVRDSDDAELVVKLTLNTDKKQGSGARLIKGDVTVGKKKYSKLVGSFEPITSIMNLTQLPNPRNPMAPIAVFQGKVAADGRSFESAGVTIANPQGANASYIGVGSPRR